ncbi:exo-beta-N-acetylmuramidase NamZ family protein [Sediminibacterium ginsengisoli]|uniref:Uncharacterized conserved protein YbbC, DUF1343 family n=1 Tax=Sediminibacterium ginsengisoli TaxID=413434 RepID=A0A1T4M8Y9_9BACT|nr:DUF1343 domain-containing protein [Sediminibacterium ginsengisoli]SJZ63371.1 Uncharacterized conserved protein YbbC, DUF1343 family [Sediminibacterium ginsengisoli]
MKTSLLGLLFLSAVGVWNIGSIAEKPVDNPPAGSKIIPAADQTEKYLPYLKGKRIGIVGNQTSVIGKTHLVDSLRSLGIQIVKAFGPEHGFRGKASAGVKVGDEVDSATGIRIISLYGPKRKPTKEDLADIDLMIYDIQDVGCRFYTYINVLADVMEACAENNKELLILDRPNPNGYFVDGPVLDMKLKSGIGKFPIPITHGMTIGEFAKMVNGEGWLANKVQCQIKIIPVANYTHDMMYTLPVNPSPNLNTPLSILLYPSTCVYEGTILNYGRGTYTPFTILGAPKLKGKYAFSFTPVSIKGMSEAPLYMNEVCYGLDLSKYNLDSLVKTKRINISWIQEMYNAYPEKEKFFDFKQSKEIGNVDYRTGDSRFKEQIMANVPEEEIRKSWEPALGNYKQMRLKYLLYK